MAQLSVYLNDSTMERLQENVKLYGCSISKYISRLINQSDQQNGWPEGYWGSIYGALKDPSFVVPPELDSSLDGALASFDANEG